jgi:hypothetical protein
MKMSIRKRKWKFLNYHEEGNEKNQLEKFTNHNPLTRYCNMLIISILAYTPLYFSLRDS